MAACESLQQIFENRLPENRTTLFDSLSSWNQTKPVDQSTFIEMFGELQCNENSQSSSSSSSSTASFPMSTSLSLSSSFTSLLDLNLQSSEGLDINKDNKRSQSPDSFAGIPKILYPGSHTKSDSFSSNSETSVHSFKYTGCHKKSDSFSSMNSESLQLCTEGLGSESFDAVEDLQNEVNEDWQNQREKVSVTKHSQTENLCGEFRKARTSSGGFPPPISCIGQSGKPWVCFKSYRHGGRFVLKEIRMPGQEFLHACREDGRLKLQFIQPNEDILELQEEEEEEEEEGEEDYGEEGEEEELEVLEEEDNGLISDVQEGETEADTRRCEAGNDLQ
ncbi:Protein FANTASTIC FOUR like [Melia azedarach]|uniref:Protein FANTASTIC FOUR like n=2 Tax=Melia azedarach TaxID=155640 RepID=A0ACC1YPA7_MELAZ|nr:Protein FANTASTIC FOUR like [Melia azedarach]KAJ4724859.1 Protein FANTASTIC FOUR like [Melia azedarach]